MAEHKTAEILNLITPEAKSVMEHIWFTADLHHAHPKIVDICNRPVYLDPKDLEGIPDDQRNMNNKWYKEMIDKAHTEWLIKDVFNKWVGKRDTVYLLGDVTFARSGDCDKFLDRLNGNKFLILGNHDRNIEKSTRFSQITQRKNFSFSQFGLNIHIVLDHFPMASWDRKPHGSWHLYGHVHGRFKMPGLTFDVGIDNSEIHQFPGGGWRPINLYEVAQIMSKKAQEGIEMEIDYTKAR